MLEKPNLPDERLLNCLRGAYGLRMSRVAFLPLGADVHTAVYHAAADDGAPYFVKLRSDAFEPLSVALPRWLGDHGVAQIIVPLATTDGRLWADLDDFAVVLYHFVAGRDGYVAPLSARHWHDFGAALRGLHTTQLPPELAQHIPRERYDERWRRMVEMFMSQLEQRSQVDAAAERLGVFLAAKHAEVMGIVERADQLAQSLQALGAELVVCHSDLHAGNILIADDGRMYIVDWDSPILAPKERDLMFIGGAQGFVGYTTREEESLFYAGYGQAQINPTALAYYRYERIIQDIAAYCEQIFLTAEGGADREPALRYVESNFWPGGTIAAAHAIDTTGVGAQSR